MLGFHSRSWKYEYPITEKWSAAHESAVAQALSHGVLHELDPAQ